MLQCNVACIYNLSTKDIYASTQHDCLFLKYRQSRTNKTDCNKVLVYGLSIVVIFLF